MLVNQRLCNFLSPAGDLLPSFGANLGGADEKGRPYYLRALKRFDLEAQTSLPSLGAKDVRVSTRKTSIRCWGPCGGSVPP